MALVQIMVLWTAGRGGRGPGQLFLQCLVIYVYVLSLYCTSTCAFPAPKDFEVNGLPGQPEGLAPMHAGYIPIDGVLPNTTKDGYLFFWLHESQGKRSDPLIVWLNGGPGCSSLVGMMYECGPITINASGDGLTPNAYSWNKAAHLLFVEQPVETGYSYSANHRLVDDEKHLSRDFYSFLRNFMVIFQDKADLDVYLFGESYAGMYVPAIAKEIVSQNHLQPNRIKLKGIAIGNGWVDSYIQTASYPEYAYARGLLDAQGRQWLRSEWIACLAATEHEGRVTAGDLASCRIMEKALEVSGHPNEYDITIYHPYLQLIAPHSAFSNYLNSATVQSAIHVTGSTLSGALSGLRSWQVCNTRMSMPDDHPVSMVHTIAELLDHDHLRVLIYNGENDINCNFMGTASYLDAMAWSKRDAWLGTSRFSWKLPQSEATAGYYKMEGNLGFLVVRNSGHLLPMDRPEEALDLAYRFTHGISFADEPLPCPWLSEAASNNRAFKEEEEREAERRRREEEQDSERYRHERLILMMFAFLVGTSLTILGSVLYASYWRTRAGYDTLPASHTFPRDSSVQQQGGGGE